MNNYQHDLYEALGKLNQKQLAQYMYITVVRTAPFYNNDYLKAVNKNGYLTLLFLSIEACRSISSSQDCSINLIPILELDRELRHAHELRHARELDRQLDRQLELAIALASDINLSSNRDLVHARDLAASVPRDRARQYARELGIDANRNFTRELKLTCDRAREFAPKLALSIDYTFDLKNSQSVSNLLYADAVLLQENRFDKLNNDTSWYGEAWKKWLDFLRELGGEYWADWYVQLFEDRFQVIDKVELDQHLSFPSELLDKELNISAQWMMKMAEKGAKHLNEARIILLGEKGAGKTSLARRLINPNAAMPKKEESTEGVDVTNVKLRAISRQIPINRDANVHIWDFAGHTITHAAHRFFLSERCLYIIVYDGRTEGRNRLTYWLDHVRNYGGKSRVLILVNLQDDHRPEIAENYFKEHYADQKCAFWSFSIQNDKARLNEFKAYLANIISTDPSWDQKIPADYFLIKEQLENVFEKEHKNHITRHEFEIISNNIIASEREILLKSLTCLGICLWYPDIKDIDLLVLNPEWITRGIYRIINWLREKGRADVSLKKFKMIFRTSKTDYPNSKHLFLYELMQKYELAYKKAYEDSIVIPQCLPEDKPKKEELPFFPPETSLYVEITANKYGGNDSRLTFPPDVLPRFIVRRNEYLRDLPIWRYGAVLKKGNVTALIEQDEFLIRIHVKGRERSDFLDELLYTLLTVLNNYRSFILEKPEISCRVTSSNGSSREMIPLNQVINLVKHMKKENITEFFDIARNMEIPLNNAKMYSNSKVNNFFINPNQVIFDSQINSENVQSNVYNNIDISELINGLKLIKEASTDKDSEILERAIKEIENTNFKEAENTIKPIANNIRDIVTGVSTSVAGTAVVQFLTKAGLWF